MPQRESTRTSTVGSERATIGPSITIKGEVSGDEDLLIQGRIDGSVNLKLQSVTVGREGRVKANISGRIVTVEGEVEGDLRAQEQVILRSSARVQGDITAPRVVLEDGANFRGLVDMGESSGTAKGTNAGASAGRTTDVSSSGSTKPGGESTGPDDASKDSGKGLSSSSRTPPRNEKSTTGAMDSATP